MLDLIVPDWPAPAGVRALVTTRAGGVSKAPWQGLNLGASVGDDSANVQENRRLLRAHLPGDPVWIRQTHGTNCVDASSVNAVVEADASYTRTEGIVCAVLTADCLPVFFCDRGATVVAVAHAGWRGLAAGVLEATISAMQIPAGQLLAWLGPAIGPLMFEVGDEVRQVFLAHDDNASEAFIPAKEDKWLANIYALARLRLVAAGVGFIGGGNENGSPGERFCTVSQKERFFSYRRDGVTGRMVSCIWLHPAGSSMASDLVHESAPESAQETI